MRMAVVSGRVVRRIFRLFCVVPCCPAKPRETPFGMRRRYDARSRSSDAYSVRRDQLASHIPLKKRQSENDKRG